MKKKGGLLWIPGTEGISMKDAIKEVANDQEFRNDLHNSFASMGESKDVNGLKGKLPSPQEMKALLEQQGIQLPAGGRRKSKTLRRKFDRCVRAVRKTVRARRGSTKKQAAYAICTKTVLMK